MRRIVRRPDSLTQTPLQQITEFHGQPVGPERLTVIWIQHLMPPSASVFP